MAWTGRSDREEGPGPWRWHEAVRPLAPGGGAGLALLGFESDAGVARNRGRTGARRGPAALREALANLPLGRCRTLWDAGDVACTGDALETAQAAYAARIEALLGAGHLPFGLGGGHEIAWGSFLGLARHLGAGAARARIGIVNFDAHFDLRAGEVPTSGTPFRQIAEECARRGWPFRYCCFGVSAWSNTAALFERARALGARWRHDEALTLVDLPEACAELGEFVREVDAVYLTVCLDVLPAHVAPGVSAPAARGIGLEVLEPLVDLVAASGRLRVADLAELNPERDVDGRTARIGARLVGRIAEAWASGTPGAHARGGCA